VQEAEEGRCPFPPLPLLPRSFLHFPFLSLAAVMAVVFVLLFLCFFFTGFVVGLTFSQCSLHFYLFAFASVFPPLEEKQICCCRVLCKKQE
jgi:hypothetical protein